MAVTMAAIAAHLLALGALIYFARRIWRALPGDVRSPDVVGCVITGLILLAVMFALPHWGFGQ